MSMYKNMYEKSFKMFTIYICLNKDVICSGHGSGHFVCVLLCDTAVIISSMG